MGRWTEAAHRAAAAAEYGDCLNPANNLAFAFLREVRRERAGQVDPSVPPDNFAVALKRAADQLADHPLRVHDYASALEVRATGPAIAALLRDDLFAVLPPAAPSEGERAAAEAARAAARAEAAVAKRRRTAAAAAAAAGAAVAAGPAPAAPPAARRRAAAASPPGAGAAAGSTPPPASAPPPAAAAVAAKPMKEYIPRIGTANYALVLALLQAQRGPERLAHLFKADLLDRAEASGLADKPLRRDEAPPPGAGGFLPGGAGGGGAGARNFYDGWSGYKKLRSEGLAYDYGRPMKVALTEAGLGLAERLYRDAVARGRCAPVAGLPAAGPLLLQVVVGGGGGEAAAEGGGAAAAAAPRRAAGGALPSAALRPARAGDLPSPRSAAVAAAERRRASGGSEGVDALAAPLAERPARGGAPAAARRPARVDPGVDFIDLAPSSGDEVAPPPPRAAARPTPSPPPPESQPLPASQQASRGHVRAGAAAAPARPRLGARPPSQQAPDASQASEQPPARARAAPQAAAAAAAAAAAGPWLDPAALRLPPLAPGRRFADAYDVMLLVDEREQYSRGAGRGGAAAAGPAAGAGSRSAALEGHLVRMRAAGLAVEARTLPIGDALWVARDRASGAEYPLDYVLERKSVADLLSSIKESGRYEDQKYRLARAGLATVFYLIEGDPDVLPSAVDQKIARSAALSTTVRDGFRVLRSGGVQETFRLYRALTEALRVLYAPLRARGAKQLPTLEAWRDSLHAATAGQTTLHDVWGRALCEVPGLGADGAAAVLAAHPTPAALWRAFDEALRRGGAPAAEAMLVGARAKGAARGLGPEKARRVFQSLFAAGWAPGC